MALARMRTATGVLAIIKEQDPDTEVSLHYLRSLINSGKFPIVPVGSKKLVNADLVIEYICAGETVQPPEPAPTTGVIRRVAV